MARPNTSRIRILEAAVDLAAEQGIALTTMDAVAERAAVAKGSVYYNFASKDELYETAFVEIGERFTSELARARDVALGPDGGAEPPTEAIIRRVAELLFARPTAAKFFAVELFGHDRLWADSVAVVRESIVEVFSDAIRATAAPPAGAFDRETAAMALLGAVLLASLDAIAFRRAESPEEIVATFRALRSLG